MTRMMQPVRLSFRRLERVWSYQSLTLLRRASESALSGCSGSSMMMKSAPRPVRIPPTEVATRLPRAVVRKSEAARLSGERRVGKDLAVEVAGHQRAAVDGVLGRELLGVAGADD